MELSELRGRIDAGEIDTVLIALCDMQGRLQGKRMDARHFVDDIVDHGAEACEYLLAVDVDMNTIQGYAHASWDTGYGDFVMRPDLATLCAVPWQEGTALVVCDLEQHDGSPVRVSPRQVLRAQCDRLAERGWYAAAGTELEFIVFEDTYEQAWDSGYRDLTPANRYNVDYSLLGTARVEDLLRRIRRDMTGAGMVVEDAKGECNLGQHEVNFRYGPVLRAADQHAVYKNGAKEIAAQMGRSLTFMAKYDEREGNSCHIHLSLQDAGGRPLFADGDELFGPWVAGIQDALAELTLLLAPNVNSYKRFAAGSFAPTAIAWGRDNRTCALRVVGHGPSRRVECRLPGGDVNPYLGLAALIAAGLDGIERGLELGEPFSGDAYSAAQLPRVPDTLKEARDLFAASALARRALGDDVVEHYVTMADVELQAFNAAVTDWERVRGFERL
jgi:glutamine synthetase